MSGAINDEAKGAKGIGCSEWTCPARVTGLALMFVFRGARRLDEIVVGVEIVKRWARSADTIMIAEPIMIVPPVDGGRP